MRVWAEHVYNGVVTGSVYALLAYGLIIIYRSTGVLNLAHGMFASAAAFAYFQLAAQWGWPAAVALPAAVAATAGLGAVSEVVAVRPIRRSDPQVRTAATIGVLLALQVVVGTVWGYEERLLAPVARSPLRVFGIVLGAQKLLLVGVAVVAAALLGLWLRRSFTGLALEAVAENPEAARLHGVNPERASLVAWTIGAALAAVAGILVTPLVTLNTYQLTLLMVPALAAAILGDFRSLPVATAGGIAIGVAQSVVTATVAAPGAGTAAGFAAVFAILLVKRRGLTSGEVLQSQGAAA